MVIYIYIDRLYICTYIYTYTTQWIINVYHHFPNISMAIINVQTYRSIPWFFVHTRWFGYEYITRKWMFSQYRTLAVNIQTWLLISAWYGWSSIDDELPSKECKRVSLYFPYAYLPIHIYSYLYVYKYMIFKLDPSAHISSKVLRWGCPSRDDPSIFCGKLFNGLGIILCIQ